MIQFEPDGIQASASPQENLLEVALKHGLQLSHSCGGNGTCGTCQVQIPNAESQLPERNEIESEMARNRKFSVTTRLACQTPAIAGITVFVR